MKLKKVSSPVSTKRNAYTILLVPDGNGKSVSLRINRTIMRSLLLFVVLFSMGMFGLIYFSGGIALKLQMVAALKSENGKLKQENQQLKQIAQKVQHIEQLNAYFRHLALEQDLSPPPVVNHQPTETVYGKDSHDEMLDTLRAVSNTEKTVPIASRQPHLLVQSVPYIRPVNGWITRRFTLNNKGGRHGGLDFAAPQGSIIVATAPGTVSEIKNDVVLGKLVVVRHAYGFETRYGHCEHILVVTGSQVKRGQTIALVGNTGRSSGPHLHYEVIRDGVVVDPGQYIIDYEDDKK